MSSTAPVSLPDLNATHYVQNSNLQNSFAMRLLKDYSFDPKEHILDVGCGDGRVTSELAKRVKEGQVVGLDPSRSMIQFASNNFSTEKFPNLSFQLGFAEDVEASPRFDQVVSFSCFHWFRNPEQAIHNLGAALKQGGKMLVLTYPQESRYYRYLEIALEKFPEYAPHSANKTMLSAHNYRQLFAKNNLSVLDLEEQQLMAYYDNETQMKEYIEGWLNSYIELPKELYASFLEEVARAVNSDPSTHIDGKIGLPYTALIIKAKKD